MTMYYMPRCRKAIVGIIGGGIVLLQSGGAWHGNGSHGDAVGYGIG
jgi:hypothetical protein